MDANWLDEFLQKQKEDAAQGKAYFVGLLPLLREKGISKLVMHYDGCGDSGDIEDVVAFSFVSGTEASMEVPELDKKAIGDAAYNALEGQCGGWEINEGSFGDIVFNTVSEALTIEHNQRIESTEYHEFEA